MILRTRISRLNRHEEATVRLLCRFRVGINIIVALMAMVEQGRESSLM